MKHVHFFFAPISRMCCEALIFNNCHKTFPLVNNKILANINRNIWLLPSQFFLILQDFSVSSYWYFLLQLSTNFWLDWDPGFGLADPKRLFLLSLSHFLTDMVVCFWLLTCWNIITDTILKWFFKNILKLYRRTNYFGYNSVYISWPTVVEGDLKAPFSMATIPILFHLPLIRTL